jgi:hypothetical protein
MKRATTVALLLPLLAPATALGQRDGVFVDPDSPAGVEYAIPLEQARQEASGDTSGNQSVVNAAQTGGEGLFGEGIRPARGRSVGDANRGGSSRNGSARGGGDASGGAAGERHPGADDASPSTAAVAAATEESSGLPLTIGIAAAVLAIGVAGGLGLRRLLRD